METPVFRFRVRFFPFVLTFSFARSPVRPPQIVLHLTFRQWWLRPYIWLFDVHVWSGKRLLWKLHLLRWFTVKISPMQ